MVLLHESADSFPALVSDVCDLGAEGGEASGRTFPHDILADESLQAEQGLTGGKVDGRGRRGRDAKVRYRRGRVERGVQAVAMGWGKARSPGRRAREENRRPEREDNSTRGSCSDESRGESTPSRGARSVTCFLIFHKSFASVSNAGCVAGRARAGTHTRVGGAW